VSVGQDAIPYQHLSHGPQLSGFLTPCLPPALKISNSMMGPHNPAINAGRETHG
jgi:hypothetical protein